jgi:hypothetical protein
LDAIGRLGYVEAVAFFDVEAVQKLLWQNDADGVSDGSDFDGGGHGYHLSLIIT